MDRQRAIPAVAVIAATAFASACGGESAAPQEAADPAGPARPVTVALAEENASGERGRAELKPAGAGTFQVILELTPADEHSYYHAHVHSGTCADYRKLKTATEQLATVVDSLDDLVEGRSTSTVYNAPLEQRTTGEYSINVHSPVNAYEVVACGEIPQTQASESTDR